MKGEKAIIVGEVESRIHESDVKKFYGDTYIPVVKSAEARDHSHSV